MFLGMFGIIKTCIKNSKLNLFQKKFAKRLKEKLHIHTNIENPQLLNNHDIVRRLKRESLSLCKKIDDDKAQLVLKNKPVVHRKRDLVRSNFQIINKSVNNFLNV